MPSRVGAARRRAPQADSRATPRFPVSSRRKDARRDFLRVRPVLPVTVGEILVDRHMRIERAVRPLRCRVAPRRSRQDPRSRSARPSYLRGRRSPAGASSRRQPDGATSTMHSPLPMARSSLADGADAVRVQLRDALPPHDADLVSLSGSDTGWFSFPVRPPARPISFWSR